MADEENYAKMAENMLASLSQVLGDVVAADTNDREKLLKILAEHILREIQAIVNTRYPPETSGHMDAASLNKSRNRLYEILGYQEPD